VSDAEKVDSRATVALYFPPTGPRNPVAPQKEKREGALGEKIGQEVL
jgi:hypothetical protein